MTSAVAQYNSPVPFRSYLLTNPSETIPPTEDLEALHAELKLLQAKTQERAKKAAEDIRTIDESMKRMREKEKGKLKALEKIKRERGCALRLLRLKWLFLTIFYPVCIHATALYRSFILTFPYLFAPRCVVWLIPRVYGIHLGTPTAVIFRSETTSVLFPVANRTPEQPLRSPMVRRRGIHPSRRHHINPGWLPNR